MYGNADNKSYNPAEDDDATNIAEVYDDKNTPPTDPDNNSPVKEDTDPFPGVPAII